MIGPAIRGMVPGDVTASLAMRARTRENAVDLDELREVYGITPESAAEALRTRQTGFLLEDQGEVVGFCIGDRLTGEVVVLALLPEYEGRGWGRQLLTLVHEVLIAEGHQTIWLWASADPAVRASGFYARFGYAPNGEMEHGDIKLHYRVG
ncbi:MAG: GNAT family N-acetyltransferase [Paracoccaceae bacterium]